MENNVIYNEDCLTTLSRMEDNSIDLVVTSPPYNKGWYADKNAKSDSLWSALNGRKIAYDVYKDEMPPEEYEKWQREIISECLRVLKPSGSIFYNHKDILYKKLTIHPKWVYDYPLHEVLIWDRQSSCTKDPHYFMPANEWIFWIVKDPTATYFDKSKAIYRTNIWRMNVDRNPHPAPFPEMFSNNCVLTCCPDGGIVYDPFMGSGTTALSVTKIGGGRRYIGSEISEKYVAMANERLGKYKRQGTLF